MEKRTLAAIALSVLVLFAFRHFEERRLAELEKRKPAPVAEPAERTAAPRPEAVPEVPAALPEEAPVPEAAGPEDTSAEARQVVVEGSLYRAVLDNRGGVITSWQLKDYRSNQGEVFEMIASHHNRGERLFPGRVVLESAELSERADRELYEVTVSDEEVDGAVSLPASVTFRLKRGSFSLEKTFRFREENYLVEMEVTALQASKPLRTEIFLAQDIGPEHEHLLNPTIPLQAVWSQGGEVERQEPEDDLETRKVEPNVRWAGLDMQYFAIVAVAPKSFDAFDIRKRKVTTTGLDGNDLTRDLLHLSIPFEGPGSLVLFVGPKKESYLESIPEADLSEVIDYGMLSFLIRPLLYALNWIVQYVDNYGLAIILLTLLLTLFLLPLRLKQVVSMKKMQKVQPKIKEIQERYKKYKRTDPRRAEMNQEIMGVYKEHGVNPLGGCFPLLLQMPLLFAFYQLLYSSIELRQAPFVLWISDLSAKDPYYVLPIVMGVTMLISQKMTPMTPGSDPTQAKIMMFMPVVFTVMFLNVSSGLNLYFLCSNIFQIGFQKIAERWVGDRGTESKGKRRAKARAKA